MADPAPTPARTIWETIDVIVCVVALAVMAKLQMLDAKEAMWGIVAIAGTRGGLLAANRVVLAVRALQGGGPPSSPPPAAPSASSPTPPTPPTPKELPTSPLAIAAALLAWVSTSMPPIHLPTIARA